MQKTFKILLIVSVFYLSGCYKTIDKMGNNTNSVILAYPSGTDYNTLSSGLDYFNQGLLNLNFSDVTDTLLVSANIAQPVSKDLNITVGVDQAAFTAYNGDTANHANYTIMPQSYFSIVNSSATIKAGQTSVTFQIVVYPSLFDISQTGYLLPISITNDPGQQVNANMKTVYFHIEKDPFPPYDRSAWTVLGFSSQEAVGEGPNNGRVIFMFDGNPNTFWHSQWQGALPGPPHWFTIDMGVVQTIHGFSFLDRQPTGANKPKDVVATVSTDDVTFTTAGAFTLQKVDSWQKITLATPVQARYFTITINSTYDANTYTNLAELKVF